MEKLTIKDLKERGLIAYEYVRGSHAYGTNIETSDKDIGGVFICPEDMIHGLRSSYIEQVDDEKHDTVYYELGRWIELLMKSNPTALESLFVPEDCVIGKVHPAVQYILDNKEKFLTKECLNPLLGYSFNQIKKAKGLNKKINIPENFERREVLDFCYTFKNQGSQPIKDFLKEHHLDQKYCGLVNIPNMKDTFGVYYDFASYFKFEVFDKSDDWTLNPDEEDKVLLTEESFQNWCFDMRYRTVAYDKFMDYDYVVKTYNRVINKEFFHYKGIVHPNVTITNPDGTTKILYNYGVEDGDETGKERESNCVRLSSIPKGEKPICFMTYNKDAYASHCTDYKEWVEWKKNRNPVRYENNKGHNYDSKNLMHTIRLMEMGVELAEGKGFNVRRVGDDVKHLLAIRNHEMSYEEIMEEALILKAKFDVAAEKTKLPEKIDYDYVNNLLIEARKVAYGWN